MIGRPGRDEAAEYHFGYIEQVPGEDVLGFLDAQSAEFLTFLQSVSEEVSLRRPGPGKWSLREIVNHINDTERVFAFRALWLGRGSQPPLPGFEQDEFAATAAADVRPLSSHRDEFIAIRAATMALLRSFPPEAWLRRGTVSGHSITTRALAWMIAGHLQHHLQRCRVTGVA